MIDVGWKWTNLSNEKSACARLPCSGELTRRHVIAAYRMQGPNGPWVVFRSTGKSRLDSFYRGFAAYSGNQYCAPFRELLLHARSRSRREGFGSLRVDFRCGIMNNQRRLPGDD